MGLRFCTQLTKQIKCSPFCLASQFSWLIWSQKKKKTTGAMHHSHKFLQSPAIKHGLKLCISNQSNFSKCWNVGLRWFFLSVFCENVINIWLNQHLVLRTVKQMLLQSFIKADQWCRRCCVWQTDGLSHTSPDFAVLFWQTIAHCTSPLTTQHHSHIQATCNRETDGCALISACWQSFSLHINT